jgi:hypothetical protein
MCVCLAHFRHHACLTTDLATGACVLQVSLDLHICCVLLQLSVVSGLSQQASDQKGETMGFAASSPALQAILAMLLQLQRRLHLELVSIMRQPGGLLLGHINCQ